MLLFLSRCKQSGTVLCVPGVSLKCDEPVDESMITPIDYEAVGPDGSLNSGITYYLRYSPVVMKLSNGIRINISETRSGTATIQLYADGQTILNSPIAVSANSTLIPKSAIKPAWQTIPAGLRLEVQILSFSIPVSYPDPTWKGLSVTYLPVGVDEI